MPAVRTTASIMAERRTKGCIQILTTEDDHKTPDHGRLERPHLRALAPRKWVRRCDPAPLSRKFHMAACVGRVRHLNHHTETESADLREACTLLYRCTAIRSAT